MWGAAIGGPRGPASRSSIGGASSAHYPRSSSSPPPHPSTPFPPSRRRAPASRPISLTFVDDNLSLATVDAAKGATIVVPFVNDVLSDAVLERLAAHGVKGVALRCAGFDNVDKAAAARLGIAVMRVPAYSPTSVAEHAVTLMCALNRKVKKSIDRTRHGNFDLSGLVGKDISTCTVGIVGTGRIGLCFARILRGFGSTLLAYDMYHSPDAAALGITYVSLEELLERSDIISLHCNLTPENTHMIDAKSLARMKPGAMLINTARGGLIDTQAAIAALKTGHLGALGIDVVEEESSVFFRYRDREVPDALVSCLFLGVAGGAE